MTALEQLEVMVASARSAIQSAKRIPEPVTASEEALLHTIVMLGKVLDVFAKYNGIGGKNL